MTVANAGSDYAARQILAVFARYKVAVGGILRRHQFFEVRDGDFQRGIDEAVIKGWIMRHARDRYRYILTKDGKDSFRSVLVTVCTPPAATESVARFSSRTHLAPKAVLTLVRP